MLAALDPLGMPLATLVVPGDAADDPLYEPAIQQARRVIGQRGRLYMGDSKMAALRTRACLPPCRQACLQAGGASYLAPLPRTGDTPELLAQLLAPVWAKKQTLERLYGLPDGDGAPKLLGVGYEATRSQQTEWGGQHLTWAERLLVVFSPMLARQERRGLAQRLARAEAELRALTPPRERGRRQWAELAPLQEAAQAILRQRQVEALLEVRYLRETERHEVRGYRERLARVEERTRYVVQVQRNAAGIRAARRGMGWRLYVVSAPGERLPLARAVQTYRGSPLIERDFRRLKERPLGIRPLYVQRDDHAKGMVRLLSLALRVLTLTEYVARERLTQAQEALTGLYAGLPKRETVRSTTERLLQAFKPITLSVVRLPDQVVRHVTPLTKLQRRILGLLDLSLCANMIETTQLRKLVYNPDS
jgi:transposase